jgi:hypothetical protein
VTNCEGGNADSRYVKTFLSSSRLRSYVDVREAHLEYMRGVEVQRADMLVKMGC